MEDANIELIIPCWGCVPALFYKNKHGGLMWMTCKFISINWDKAFSNTVLIIIKDELATNCRLSGYFCCGVNFVLRHSQIKTIF